MTVEDADRVGAADAVGGDAAVRLEVGEGARGARAEDAVDSPAVEAEPTEPGLQLGDVVTAQVRRGEEQQPVAELPGRLDQRRPGVLVAAAVAAQAAAGLEGADGGLGGRAKTAASAPAAGGNPAAPRRRCRSRIASPR